MDLIERSLLHAGVAAAGVLCLVPLIRRVALATGVVAHPKADRWHRRTVPMLGGIALFGGVLLSATLAPTPSRELLPLMVAAVGMFLVGLVDDLRHMRPGTKLGAQVAVSCASVALSGGAAWTGWPNVDALLTIFWIIAITNAVNLLDNMDGLCAGIAAVAGIACWGAFAGGAAVWSLYAAALTGACLGFLLFNFNPASIFMGDSGSLFLGATLAVLATGEGTVKANVLSAIAVPALILLIPIFDTSFVTISRLLSRRAPSSGGRDHTSHRLVAMGFSEREAVLILWMLGAAGGGVALLSERATEATFVGPLLLIGLVLLGIQLARVRVYDGEDFSALIGRKYTPLLVEVTYRRRLFELILDVLLVALCYYAAYALRFDDAMELHAHLLLQSLPIVIGCQITSFLVVGVYRGTWRYISLGDLSTFVKGIALGTVTSVIALLYLYRFEGYSRGVFLIYALLAGGCVIGARLSERVLLDIAGRHRRSGRPALIYGAGDAGALLLRELRSNSRYEYLPVAFIDDDTAKHRKRMMGLHVIGGIEALPHALGKLQPDVLIVSTRTLPPEKIRQVAVACAAAGTRLMQFRVSLDSLELHEPVGTSAAPWQQTPSQRVPTDRR